MEIMWRRERTSLNLRGSPSAYTTTRLIRTLEPSRVPSYTRPEASGWPSSGRRPGSAHDFGNISLAPHIVLSSCKHSRNAGFVWSGTPMRTYAGVEHGVERRFENSRYASTRLAMTNPPLEGLEQRFDTRSRGGSY